MAPHLQNLNAASTLVSQVAETIRTGSAPIWTSQLSLACRLTLASLRTHAAIAPHQEEARQVLASWPSRSLAAVIVDTQRWMLGRLVLILPVRDSLEWWCTTKGRPAYTFYSGWELLHTVCTAMAEPLLPRARDLVEKYAFHVETHLAAWQVALPRFAEVGAAVLHLTGSSSRLADKALVRLLHYMPRASKVDRLPGAWAGRDQDSVEKGGGPVGLSDASQERMRHLWELLAPIRDMPITERLERALDREDDYLPHAAGLDFLNRLATYRQQEKLVTEEPLLHGAEEENRSPRTPEAIRQALGQPPEFGRISDFCLSPPADFLESLSPAELNTFRALCKAVVLGTLPSTGGVWMALAKTAQVSPATVTDLVKKIRSFL